MLIYYNIEYIGLKFKNFVKYFNFGLKVYYLPYLKSHFIT